MLEEASRLLLQLSEKQMNLVEDGIALFRMHQICRNLPLPKINDIRLAGFGMYEPSVGGGKDLRRYSVTRSGLNTWCDACRIPIGAKVRYREYSRPSAL
jgi:hypothetical protein